VKALVYLQCRLFINSIRNTLTTPKKLIPAIVIGLALFMQLGSMLITVLIHGAADAYQVRKIVQYDSLTVETAWSTVFSLLSMLVLYMVYRALSDGLLIFSQAHIDFLFPSPVNRRSILAMKLIGDYAKITAIVGFFALYIGMYYVYLLTGRHIALAAWIATVSLIILSVNVTHTVKIVTTYGVRRLQLAARIIKLFILAAFASVLVVGFMHYVNSQNTLESFVAAISGGPVRIILLPVAWCTDAIMGPFYSAQPAYLLELLWLVLLALGSTVILLLRPENFYEPSLSISSRVAKIKSARLSSDWTTMRRELNKDKVKKRYKTTLVPPFGTGAAAIIWKNAVIRTRNSTIALLFLVLLPPIAAKVAGSYMQSEDLRHYCPLALIYFWWFFLAISQNRCRMELRQADIIKSMPISGRGIVGCWVIEHSAPLILFILICGASMRVFIPDVNTTVLWYTVLGCITGGISTIAATSIVGILYPDIQDKLQQMIGGFVTMAFMGVALSPTLLAALIMGSQNVSLVIAIPVMMVLNGVVTYFAISIAGSTFNKFDPTAS
jgi:hypothetical protein